MNAHPNNLISQYKISLPIANIIQNPPYPLSSTVSSLHRNTYDIRRPEKALRSSYQIKACGSKGGFGGPQEPAGKLVVARAEEIAVYCSKNVACRR